jgi:predicted lysophospholipase L1 biosynthesis ABC-type transport system permease subunit
VPEPRDRWSRRSIFTLQVLSILLMWAFLGGAIAWMVNVVGVALTLGDALTASVAISLIAVSVYTLVASVLTYVFFGLRRGRRVPETR